MDKFKKILCGTTITALLIINVILIVIIIGLIIEANTTPKHSDEILYASEVYEYKEHKVSVKIRNVTDLDMVTNTLTIVAEFYCDGRKMSLFSKSFDSEAKDEYNVTFDEESFSIHINNNHTTNLYDYDIIYQFNYDNVIKNF